METLTAKHKPYTTYKPSGVEWLDEIPAHWEVAAVKRHFSIQLVNDEMLAENIDPGMEAAYVDIGNVPYC